MKKKDDLRGIFTTYLDQNLVDYGAELKEEIELQFLKKEKRNG